MSRGIIFGAPGAAQEAPFLVRCRPARCIVSGDRPRGPNPRCRTKTPSWQVAPKQTSMRLVWLPAKMMNPVRPWPASRDAKIIQEFSSVWIRLSRRRYVRMTLNIGVHMKKLSH